MEGEGAAGGKGKPKEHHAGGKTAKVAAELCTRICDVSAGLATLRIRCAMCRIDTAAATCRLQPRLCVEESEQEVGCECGRQGRRGGGEKRDVERGKKRGKKAWERTQGPNIRLGKIWSETEEKFEKGGRGRRGKEGGNGKDENEVELPRTVVAMLRI
eukprot:3865949-Rhodomonas_salina.1